MAGTLAHSGLLRAKSRKAPLFFELIKHVFRIRPLAVELDDLERSLFGGQIGDRAEVLDARLPKGALRTCIERLEPALDDDPSLLAPAISTNLSPSSSFQLRILG